MTDSVTFDENEFVRSILAQWELAARLSAAESLRHKRSDEHYRAWLGYPFEGHPNYPALTKEEIADVIAKFDGRIENSDIAARAWLRIRARLLDALRAEGGEQIYEQGEVPPTKRQPHVERAPVVLPSVDKITDTAKANGIEVIE